MCKHHSRKKHAGGGTRHAEPRSGIHRPRDACHSELIPRRQQPRDWRREGLKRGVKSAEGGELGELQHGRLPLEPIAPRLSGRGRMHPPQHALELRPEVERERAEAMRELGARRPRQ